MAIYKDYYIEVTPIEVKVYKDYDAWRTGESPLVVVSSEDDAKRWIDSQMEAPLPEEKPKITPSNREVAIRVMMNSKLVKDWVEGVMSFFNIDATTPEGKETYERLAREQAEKLVR